MIWFPIFVAYRVRQNMLTCLSSTKCSQHFTWKWYVVPHSLTETFILRLRSQNKEKHKFNSNSLFFFTRLFKSGGSKSVGLVTTKGYRMLKNLQFYIVHCKNKKKNMFDLFRDTSIFPCILTRNLATKIWYFMLCGPFDKIYFPWVASS